MNRSLEALYRRQRVLTTAVIGRGSANSGQSWGYATTARVTHTMHRMPGYRPEVSYPQLGPNVDHARGTLEMPGGRWGLDGSWDLGDVKRWDSPQRPLTFFLAQIPP